MLAMTEAATAAAPGSTPGSPAGRGDVQSPEPKLGAAIEASLGGSTIDPGWTATESAAPTEALPRPDEVQQTAVAGSGAPLDARADAQSLDGASAPRDSRCSGGMGADDTGHITFVSVAADDVLGEQPAPLSCAGESVAEESCVPEAPEERRPSQAVEACIPCHSLAGDAEFFEAEQPIAPRSNTLPGSEEYEALLEARDRLLRTHKDLAEPDHHGVASAKPGAAAPDAAVSSTLPHRPSVLERASEQGRLAAQQTDEIPAAPDAADGFACIAGRPSTLDKASAPEAPVARPSVLPGLPGPAADATELQRIELELRNLVQKASQRGSNQEAALIAEAAAAVSRAASGSGSWRQDAAPNRPSVLGRTLPNGQAVQRPSTLPPPAEHTAKPAATQPSAREVVQTSGREPRSSSVANGSAAQQEQSSEQRSQSVLGCADSTPVMLEQMPSESSITTSEWIATPAAAPSQPARVADMKPSTWAGPETSAMGLGVPDAGRDVKLQKASSLSPTAAAPGRLALRGSTRWEPNAAQCSRCHTTFSALHRRHHCRYCGRLVCSACSAAGGLLLEGVKVRVCADCTDGRPSVLDPRGLAPLPEQAIRRRPVAARVQATADGSHEADAADCERQEPEVAPLEAWMENGLPDWAKFVQNSWMPAGARAAWFEGFATLEVKVMQAAGLAAADLQVLGRSSDPFLVIEYDGQAPRTCTIQRTMHPRWNDTFRLRMRCPWAPLRMRIYDWDRVKADDFLGAAVIPGEVLCRLPVGKTCRGWVRCRQNVDPHEAPADALGAVFLEIRLLPLCSPTLSLPQEVCSKDVQRRLRRASYLQAGWDKALQEEEVGYDPDYAFAPLACIIDKVWTKWLWVGIKMVLAVLRWDDYKVSLRWFVIITLLCIRPAWLWFCWTVWVGRGLRQKIIAVQNGEYQEVSKTVRDELEGPADDTASNIPPDPDQVVQSFATNPSYALNGWASTLLKNFMPTKHQSTVTAWQPRLRRWAGTIETVDNLFRGRHKHSPILLNVFYGFAAAQIWPVSARCYLFIWTVFWFILFTPVWTVIVGHFSWRKLQRSGPASCADVFDDTSEQCPDDWRSESSRRTFQILRSKKT
eukprot:TRINITY_DN61116_c0_g1_i1.p1 TRINITY_DN61116_c0_g1~~TRINITY_DN61116_c0_g1_i1.p1  ORF type:complete len:1098 (-),score=152.10 TRINITY_DN61116_c0_g1_i1:451-3744(-)